MTTLDNVARAEFTPKCKNVPTLIEMLLKFLAVIVIIFRLNSASILIVNKRSVKIFNNIYKRRSIFFTYVITYVMEKKKISQAFVNV